VGTQIRLLCTDRSSATDRRAARSIVPWHRLIVTLGHEKLVAWQRADDLFVAIHRLTADFPSDQRYTMVNQLRRAAYSVPANIVEGVARRSPRDRARFLGIAQSSLAEVGYCLHASRRLGFISPTVYDEFERRVRQVAAPLAGLIRSLQSGSGLDNSRPERGASGRPA
jgi:four helix bundle protein